MRKKSNGLEILFQSSNNIKKLIPLQLINFNLISYHKRFYQLVYQLSLNIFGFKIIHNVP